MNKISKYAHIVETNGRIFLYNVSNGKIIMINPMLRNLLEEYRSNIDALSTIHNDFLEGLIKTRMVVNTQTDETADLVARLMENEATDSIFRIIINPTLDCNLRCWYCYESHLHGSMMQPHVIDAVKRLIDIKLSNPATKILVISFFGGEPLLGWDKVVVPLLEYAVEICNSKGIRIESAFTTNGVLLSKQKFDKLKALGLGNTKFQITLDGNRAVHDNSRVGANKIPTYNVIMNNVLMGTSQGFPMTLRFNYTPDNIDSFADILSDLTKFPEAAKNKITCSFNQVWQTASSGKDVISKVEDMTAMFRGEKICANTDRFTFRYICYADYENSVIINYNGDTYKCTAREFDPKNREGVLNEDGIIEWTDRHRQRMAAKFSNKTCLQCPIMPICNGGCSQNKLEHPESGCMKKFSDTERRDYLTKALLTVLGKE